MKRLLLVLLAPVTFKTTGDLIDIDGRLVDVGDL